jgi:hypothetical protein
MKNTACVLILALALLPAGAEAQEKGKAKGTDKERTTVEQSTPKAQPATPQGKAKGKGRKGEAEGTSGAVGTQGPGSCSPDTTPPVIRSVTATPNVLWSPNHRMTPVSISANVTDNCSAATWSVTAIASDEPVNGTGDGDTEPDWSITGGHGVNLRAERAGSGDGRIYTITITARDVAGNRATATTTVSVPHSQKK